MDPELFSTIKALLGEWDRRALLALHAAVADKLGSFSYLEIGSYLGGSLQVLIRDPDCRRIVSIDPRLVVTPDDGMGQMFYDDNTTESMLGRLRSVPDAAMEKLTTFETGTDSIPLSALPERPDYCFVDGEHTYDAVLRDASFCAEAMGGKGVIAFHDYGIVGAAISAFLREHWREISFALAFATPPHPTSGGGIFALELGDQGLLKHPLVDRAMGSRWHSVVWRAVNRRWLGALPLLGAWALMPAVDAFVVHARHGWEEYLRQRDAI